MADFIRVRDTRTKAILPHPVPRAHLKAFPHLKEVPSSVARRERLEDTPKDSPAPRVEEPQAPTARGTSKHVTEPAKPEKEAN